MPGEVNVDGRCERRPGGGGNCPPGQVRGVNGCEPIRPDNKTNVATNSGACSGSEA